MALGYAEHFGGQPRPIFWGGLMAINPLPCDMHQGATAAVTTAPDDRLTVVVAPVEALPSERVTLIVQLRDMAGGEAPVLDVLLGDDYRFLRGRAFGRATDETGAADALGALTVGVHLGPWDIQPPEESGR